MGCCESDVAVNGKKDPRAGAVNGTKPGASPAGNRPLDPSGGNNRAGSNTAFNADARVSVTAGGGAGAGGADKYNINNAGGAGSNHIDDPLGGGGGAGGGGKSADAAGVAGGKNINGSKSGDEDSHHGTGTGKAGGVAGGGAGGGAGSGEFFGPSRSAPNTTAVASLIPQEFAHLRDIFTEMAKMARVGLLGPVHRRPRGTRAGQHSRRRWCRRERHGGRRSSSGHGRGRRQQQ